MAKGLLEYETLTGDQIRKVIAGEALSGTDDDAGNADAGGGTPGLAAIPKTRGRSRKSGMEPEPSV